MEKSSFRLSRFSGHKPDDGHRAAGTKSKDITPLIRIVDAAARNTRPDQAVKVLYLKQDVHGKSFLTTDFDAPEQHPAYKPPSLRPSQHLDATSGETRRAVYWMNKFPDDPAIQTAGAALIDRCVSPSTTEFGLPCTAALRDELQALHDAINPSDALPGRKDSDSGQKTGVFGSLRRTLTNPRSRSSRSASPEKRPRDPNQSPRVVSFSPVDETHFPTVSPRKITPRSTVRGTPHMGQERDAGTPSPKSPSQAMSSPDRLKHLEENRPHPRPSLPTTPKQHSQTNTPGISPREPD